MFILGCLTVTILTIDKIIAQGSEIHIKIMMGKNKLKVILNITYKIYQKQDYLK
jgi:hypothetical protein